MATCSNCYSGCAEITSDKCVKYTGLNIEVLGIQNGDSINYVASAIAGFLVSTLDGSGIKYELAAEDMCAIITNELTNCTDITVVEITRALSVAICAVDTRVTALEVFQTALEGSYTPDCVPGVTGTEGTHAVLQAVINHLCTVDAAVDAVELDLSTNYVAIADIESYIANYINTYIIGGGQLQRDKMVPYTVVEYYGSLTYFDSTGAGTGDWIDVYLCNGNNGTPDKRGRIPVGTTSGMGGGAYPSATDPLISGNPTYALYTTTGSNTVTLTANQIPSHSHTATVSTAPDHTHYLISLTNSGSSFTTNTELTIDEYHSTGGNLGYSLRGSSGALADRGVSGDAGSHTHTVTNTATGGGLSHNNIPPVLACHYIIYIPS